MESRRTTKKYSRKADEIISLLKSLSHVGKRRVIQIVKNWLWLEENDYGCESDKTLIWNRDGSWKPMRFIRKMLKEKLNPLPKQTKDWFRACGECLCKCGYEYRLHPIDDKDEFLCVLCDGSRVKL